MKKYIFRDSNYGMVIFKAFSVNRIDGPPAKDRTQSSRPLTAGGMGFGRRPLADLGGKGNEFDKRHVQIMYRGENLANAWLAEFVVNWLRTRTQTKLITSSAVTLEAFGKTSF